MRNDKLELNNYIEALSKVFSDIVVVDLQAQEVRWEKQTYSRGTSPGPERFPDGIYYWINHVVGEEDREQLRDGTRRLIRDVRNGSYEARFSTDFRVEIPGQGDQYFGLIAWSLEPGYLLFCCENITDSRRVLQRTEIRLQQEHAHVEELLRTMGVVVLEWNVLLRRFSSTGAYDAYEVSRYLYDVGAVDQDDLRDCVHPADIPVLERLISAYRNGAERVEELVRMQMRSGVYQWTRLLLAVEYDERRAPRTLTGFLINEEGRVLYERALDYQRGHLLNALNVLPDGIFVFRMQNEHAQIIYFSKNIARYFQLDPNQYSRRMNAGFSPELLVEDRNQLLSSEDFRTLCSRGRLERIWREPSTGEEVYLRILCRQGDAAQSVWYAEIVDVTEEHRQHPPVIYGGQQEPVRTGEGRRAISVRTFGYFEVFLNGHPLQFRHEKSKELLALLVDRRGGSISAREAISILWEDETIDKVTLARYRKVAMRLHRMLEEYGIGDLVEVIDHKRRLNTDLVQCDLYDYLTGKPEYAHLFGGSYLLNYSWGEITAADLQNQMWIHKSGGEEPGLSDK